MSNKQFATGPIRRPLRGSLCCPRPDKQQHDVRPSLLVVPVAAQSGSVTRCWFRVEARAEPHPAGTEIAATARTIPRARALRRKAGVRISAAPSSSSLVVAPSSSRQTGRSGPDCFARFAIACSPSITRRSRRKGSPRRHDRFRRASVVRATLARSSRPSSRQP
jgi:hypothetical protein